ncbi:HlyD family efflux transporter periplasmic adaptor subunit [Nitrobacter sp.]|jgi:membrane fusion protein|uniref:HlyD family efflux transporter periplasmic adaptor subunit n=1 Tax=Nitrobacter sp. TaxID=29420 RepID=UPI003F64D7C0
MSDLFRREAIEHATQRLEGQVFLASPLSLKTLGLLLSGIVFAAATFAATATYARKTTVSGFLVPDQGMIRITSQAQGTLRSVLVKEGDNVEKGTRLAILDVSTATATGNTGDALLKGFESESLAAKSRAESKLALLELERDQANVRISKSQNELAEVDQQIELQQERLKLAREEVDRGEAIAAKGYLPKREVDQRRLAALAIEQDLAGARRQKATVERELADIKSRLVSIPLEIKAARSDADVARATLEQRRAESEARRLQFFVAPTGGRIAALPVSDGQAVAAGGMVAVIIPSGSEIEAELLAPSRAIGFVQPGQQVELSLQAFPYQRFGTVRGTVRTVSSTVLGPADVGFPGLDIKEPVFRIRVSLSRSTMEAYGQSVPMQPGMLVSAEIVFEHRSLLRWLFDPIYAVGRRA